MSIREWPLRRRDVVVATLVALCTVFAAGSTQASDIGNIPPGALGWSDSGDLLSWRTGSNRSDELVRAGEVLFGLEILAGGRSLEQSLVWRRQAARPGQIANFVGTARDGSFQIERRYVISSGDSAIIHQFEVTSRTGEMPADLQVRVWLYEALQERAPDEGSLGEIFYGYTRWLAKPSLVEPFESGRWDQSVVAVAAVVRHRAVVLTPESVDESRFTIVDNLGIYAVFEGLALGGTQEQMLTTVVLDYRSVVDTQFQSLMYSETSSPIRGLARLIEYILIWLSDTVGSTGLSVVLFAIVLRLAMMPLGLWSIRQQRHFTSVQKKMKPKIDEINKTRKGADKSERILQTYKEFGVSPFSGLKGSLGLFVQLPILIALFAITTESAMFRDTAFLWLNDLSMPDHALTLATSIPGLGTHLNLLPLLLGVVCVVSALIQTVYLPDHSPKSGLILALLFVIFFYSCAAALVIYWLTVNVLQIAEGRYAIGDNLVNERNVNQRPAKQ